MKIEKLTENKIRVIVNTEDLKENDIDFNLLMNKINGSSKSIF